jgi:hypothetical protein
MPRPRRSQTTSLGDRSTSRPRFSSRALGSHRAKRLPRPPARSLPRTPGDEPRRPCRPLQLRQAPPWPTAHTTEIARRTARHRNDPATRRPRWTHPRVRSPRLIDRLACRFCCDAYYTQRPQVLRLRGITRSTRGCDPPTPLPCDSFIPVKRADPIARYERANTWTLQPRSACARDRHPGRRRRWQTRCHSLAPSSRRLDEQRKQLSLRTPVPAVWLQLATFAPALKESPHRRTAVTRTSRWRRRDSNPRTS